MIISSSRATMPSQVVVWYSAILTIRSSLRTAMGENPILPIQVPRYDPDKICGFRPVKDNLSAQSWNSKCQREQNLLD